MMSDEIVGVNVDDGDFEEWRSDACRVSVMKSDDDESEIVEESVVLVVDGQQVVDVD